MIKRYYVEYVDPTCVRLHGFEEYTQLTYWFRSRYLFFSSKISPGKTIARIQDDCIYDAALAGEFKKYGINVIQFVSFENIFCSLSNFTPQKPFEIAKAEYLDDRGPAWSTYQEPTIFYHGFIGKEDVGVIFSVDRMHNDFLMMPVLLHGFREVIKPFGDYQFFLTKDDMLSASKLFCSIATLIRENLTVKDKYIELSGFFADAAKKYDCIGVTMSDLEDLERKGIL